MSRGGARLGAGRPPSKGRTEDYRRVDVRKLARQGMLRAGLWACQWVDRGGGRTLARLLVEPREHHIDLTYFVGLAAVTCRVTMTWTACHLGGERCWFQCPRCGRRVAVLLLDGSRIACTRCVATSYRSQRVDFCGRTWLKQHKLEARLEPGFTCPQGMSHDKYARILAAIGKCQRERAAWLGSALARVNEDLNDLRWRIGLAGR